MLNWHRPNENHWNIDVLMKVLRRSITYVLGFFGHRLWFWPCSIHVPALVVLLVVGFAGEGFCAFWTLEPFQQGPMRSHVALQVEFCGQTHLANIAYEHVLKHWGKKSCLKGTDFITPYTFYIRLHAHLQICFLLQVRRRFRACKVDISSLDF